MSLYLGIFDQDAEVYGWVLGHYSDFGCFRDTVRRFFTPDQLPLLLGHSDCDGEWEPSVLPSLRQELLRLAARFRELPPEVPDRAFEHTTECRQNASFLYDCFHNVDGENLIEALIDLCDRASALNLSISFQ